MKSISFNFEGVLVAMRGVHLCAQGVLVYPQTP